MSRQEELQALSDSEINKLVNDIKYPIGSEYQNRFNELPVSNYCKNAGSIMPIFVKNELFLNCMGELDDGCVYWEASSNHYKVERKNPYRAICEVFILMNEAKQ